jgi:hypothetical protein
MRKISILAMVAVWLLASCVKHPALSTGGKAVSTQHHAQLDSASNLPVAPKTQAVEVHTNSFAAPDDPSTITYDSGLVSQPIDPAYLPPVDAVAAVKAATIIGFNASLQPGTPTVTLRSVSIGYEGQSTFTAHPAWIIIWHGSMPWATGGANRISPPTGKSSDNLNCIYVMAVNAVTGRAEDARQLCSG